MTRQEAIHALKDLLSKRQVEQQKLINLGVDIEQVSSIIHSIDGINQEIRKIKTSYNI